MKITILKIIIIFNNILKLYFNREPRSNLFKKLIYYKNIFSINFNREIFFYFIFK